MMPQHLVRVAVFDGSGGLLEKRTGPRVSPTSKQIITYAIHQGDGLLCKNDSKSR